jgi:hypothetical protein
VEPLRAGDRTVVEITYATRPRKGFFFVGPTEAEPNREPSGWSQGQANDTHGWIPCLESTESRGTLEMIVKVPAGYRAIGNGKLVSRKVGLEDVTSVVESMGSYVEVYRIDRKRKDHEEMLKQWWLFLRTAWTEEPIGQRYLRRMLVTFKFELNVCVATLGTIIGAGLGVPGEDAHRVAEPFSLTTMLAVIVVRDERRQVLFEPGQLARSAGTRCCTLAAGSYTRIASVIICEDRMQRSVSSSPTGCSPIRPTPIRKPPVSCRISLRKLMLQPIRLRTGETVSGSPRYVQPTTQSNSSGNQAGRPSTYIGSILPPTPITLRSA